MGHVCAYMLEDVCVGFSASEDLSYAHAAAMAPPSNAPLQPYSHSFGYDHDVIGKPVGNTFRISAKCQ